MRAPAALLSTLILVAACGGGAPDDPNASGVFIALARDFVGFEDWTAFDLGDDQNDGVVVLGHRRAYVNMLPPHGSTTFPVGTIIIKTIGEELPMPGQTFAMAKRGGTWNAAGASGWEWFELVLASPEPPAIRWRGIVPPAGEIYAGVSGGACNMCHQLGRDNDFVPSTELLLSQF
ncbi:MAG: hypothetical protein ABUL77_02000 [Bacteroidota bacterium]